MARRKPYSSEPSKLGSAFSGIIKALLMAAVLWATFWVGAHFSTHQQLMCDISTTQKNIAFLQAMSTSDNKTNAFTQLLQREQDKATKLQADFTKANSVSAFALAPIEGIQQFGQKCAK